MFKGEVGSEDGFCLNRSVILWWERYTWKAITKKRVEHTFVRALRSPTIMDFWTWERQKLCGRASLRASLWAAKESDGLWHGGIVRKWIFIFIRWPPVERTCVGVPQLRYAPASVCYSSRRRAENGNKAQSHTGLQLEQRFEPLKCGTSMFLMSFIARQTSEASQVSVTAGGRSLSALWKGSLWALGRHYSLKPVNCSYFSF